MAKVLQGVTGKVLQVPDAATVETQCRENFNLKSDCMAAVVFNDVDVAAHTLVSSWGLVSIKAD